MCRAVQHARLKGIGHRDLNTATCSSPTWTAARRPRSSISAWRSRPIDADRHEFRDPQAIVGTPACMSPEQAEPSSISMDIDTRTAVYALEVMLCELLGGSQPINSKQFERWMR